jgi:hypothetical protein
VWHLQCACVPDPNICMALVKTVYSQNFHHNTTYSPILDEDSHTDVIIRVSSQYKSFYIIWETEDIKLRISRQAESLFTEALRNLATGHRQPRSHCCVMSPCPPSLPETRMSNTLQYLTEYWKSESHGTVNLLRYTLSAVVKSLSETCLLHKNL